MKILKKIFWGIVIFIGSFWLTKFLIDFIGGLFWGFLTGNPEMTPEASSRLNMLSVSVALVVSILDTLYFLFLRRKPS